MQNDNTTQAVNTRSDSGTKQIVGAIILAGAMIAGAILLRGGGGSRAEPIAGVPIQNRAVAANEHVLGNPNAEIKIVEYSDTECPYCKVFHNTLHTVLEQNNNVAWVYRHYPIAQLHQKAFHEAEATECAWEQGGNDAFWKYIDEVFKRTESNDTLDEAELPKIAQDIGLDIAVFNSCLSSAKYADKIEADIEDAGKAGARGTPYSLIITKKDISKKTQRAILSALDIPEGTREEEWPISFSSTSKNTMSLNGALPIEMVNAILSVLSE